MKGGVVSGFGSRIDQINQSRSDRQVRDTNSTSAGGREEFAQILNSVQSIKPESTQAAKGKAGIQFSNHAIERMMRRGLHLSPDEMGRLNQAVAKAEQKGARDTLVLMDNKALIVSIKDRTVVTIMDQSALKENVFTNIDSTVMV